MKKIQLRDHAQEIRFLPFLKVDQTVGFIELSGYCLPMDVVPVFKRIDQYVDRCFAKGKLRFVFNLIHFNTPSSKMIHLLLKKMEKFQKNNDEVAIEVLWYYQPEDYEMQEAGEEFADLVPHLDFSWFAYRP